MNIRKAEKKDINDIVIIIKQAKNYFKKNGIPQWQGEYPNEIDIEDDIQKQGGYCVIEDNEVIAYSFVSEYEDPNYSYIEGSWLNDEPYVVIHRTCVKETIKGRGVATSFVTYAKKICKDNGLRNIRVDTHEKNISMQRMLEKNGFVKTGIIYVEDGSPRYAYQLVL
jgi:ribosomal protein S18 acetylase RimI-like enzyme